VVTETHQLVGQQRLKSKIYHTLTRGTYELAVEQCELAAVRHGNKE